MTENPKENFLLAFEIMVGEQKFNILACGAPLVMFVAKLDIILQIQGAYILKLFLTISFVSLFFGLCVACYVMSVARAWKAKEVLFMSGETYKGRGEKYLAYIESVFQKSNVNLDEEGSINLAKKTVPWSAGFLIIGWLCLIISLLIALWSDNPLTASQGAVTESTVIIHTQEKSEN